jgi:hypothetical protein
VRGRTGQLALDRSSTYDPPSRAQEQELLNACSRFSQRQRLFLTVLCCAVLRVLVWWAPSKKRTFRSARLLWLSSLPLLPLYIILLTYIYQPWKIQPRKDMVSVSFVFGERCEKVVSLPRIF